MTYEQLTIDSFSALSVASNVKDFTPAELAENGIQKAVEAAGTDWKKEALKSLRLLLETHKHVTADMLETKGHENARGGIFQTAAKKGWCRFTGTYQKSTTPQSHGRMIRVWESLL